MLHMLSTAALLLLSITVLVSTFHLHQLSTEVRQLRKRMDAPTDQADLMG